MCRRKAHVVNDLLGTVLAAFSCVTKWDSRRSRRKQERRVKFAATFCLSQFDCLPALIASGKRGDGRAEPNPETKKRLSGPPSSSAGDQSAQLAVTLTAAEVTAAKFGSPPTGPRSCAIPLPHWRS